MSASRLLRVFWGFAPKALYVSRHAAMWGTSVTVCLDRRSLAVASASTRRVSLVVSLGPGGIPSTTRRRAR